MTASVALRHASPSGHAADNTSFKFHSYFIPGTPLVTNPQSLMRWSAPNSALRRGGALEYVFGHGRHVGGMRIRAPTVQFLGFVCSHDFTLVGGKWSRFQIVFREPNRSGNRPPPGAAR